MDNTKRIKYSQEYNKLIMPRLEELIEPLKALGIIDFSYMKIIDNKKCFRIGNNLAVQKLFFERRIYDQLQLTNWPKLGTEGVVPYYRIWNLGETSQGDKMRRDLGLTTGVTIYRSTKDYKEAWSFSCPPDQREKLNFIINNQDLLLKYIAYFKSVASDILDVSDPKKLFDINITENEKYSTDDFVQSKSHFEDLLEHSRYSIESPLGQFWLTKREVECLKYKDQGYSAKETARKLGISNRTVENILDNIRSKSPMQKVSETILLCRQQGLI